MSARHKNDTMTRGQIIYRLDGQSYVSNEVQHKLHVERPNLKKVASIFCQNLKSVSPLLLSKAATCSYQSGPKKLGGSTQKPTGDSYVVHAVNLL